MNDGLLLESNELAIANGISLDPGSAFQKRLVNAFLIGLPAFGTVYSLVWFNSHRLGWIEISCFLIFYLVIGIGIGVGFHRCFTHKSFRPVWPLKAMLLAAGSMAFQGSVLRWVADHRRHHRFADKPWDTHSPYVRVTNAIQNPVFGIVHAHVGWMFDQTTTSYRKYAKDLLRDRTIMLFHYMYLPLTWLSLLLPYLYGFALGGTEHAIGCLLLVAGAHYIVSQCCLGSEFDRSYVRRP